MNRFEHKTLTMQAAKIDYCCNNQQAYAIPGLYYPKTTTNAEFEI